MDEVMVYILSVTYIKCDVIILLIKAIYDSPRRPTMYIQYLEKRNLDESMMNLVLYFMCFYNSL